MKRPKVKMKIQKNNSDLLIRDLIFEGKKTNIYSIEGKKSSVSNNNLDMFEEMKIGSILQKHEEEDPTRPFGWINARLCDKGWWFGRHCPC